MIKRFRKNTAKILAFTVAVFMVLSVLPISELIFAATVDNYTVQLPGNVSATVTLTDENDVSNEFSQDTDSDFKAVFNGLDDSTQYTLSLTGMQDYKDYTVSGIGIVADGTFTVDIGDLTGKDVIASESISWQASSGNTYTGDSMTLVSFVVKNGDKVTVTVDSETYSGYNNYIVTAAEETIEVKKTNAGTYNVNVSLERPDCKPFTKNASVKILNQLDFSGLTITPFSGLVYNGEAQDLISVGSNPNNYTLQYVTEQGESITPPANDSNAWKTDIPKATNAGSYTVWVKVSNGEDYEEKQYSGDPYPYSVTIAQKEQTLTFEKFDYCGNPMAFVKMPDEFDKSLEDTIYLNDWGKLCYRATSDVNGIIGESKYYEIDTEKTTAGAQKGNGRAGEIDYYGPGKVVVNVTAPESKDKNYKETKVTYTVNIVRKDYAEDGSIIENSDLDNAIKEFINSNFTEKAAYTDQSGDAPVYWFKDGPVTLSAPEGWHIVKTDVINLQKKLSWVSAIQESNEAKYDDYRIVFKDSNGDISDFVTLPEFAIDKTKPTISRFEFTKNNQNPFSKILNFLTFGFLFNESVDVTVTAADFVEGKESSGIDSIALYYNEKPHTDFKKVNKNGEATFTLSLDEFNTMKTVSAVAKDNTGKKSDPTFISTGNSNFRQVGDGTVQLEATEPEIEITPADVIYSNGDEKWYNDDVKFDVTVKDEGDENSGIRSVCAKINGSYVDISDFSISPLTELEIGEEKIESNNEHYYFINEKAASIKFSVNTNQIDPIDGKYTVTIVAVDNAGNETEPAIKTIYVDRTSPVISGFDFKPTDYLEVKKNEQQVYDLVDFEDATYGFYFKEKATVIVHADDVNIDDQLSSGVKRIRVAALDSEGRKYTVVTDPENDNALVLEEITEWGDDNANIIWHDVTDGVLEFIVFEDFKGQIYAFAEDNVGNNPNNSYCTYDPKKTTVVNEEDPDDVLNALVGYVHPNASILETDLHHILEGNHISIKLPDNKYTQNDGTPLYNDDVTLAITVNDLYAGIRSVEWEVKSDKDQGNNHKGKLTINSNGTDCEYEDNNQNYKDGKADWQWDITNNDINLVPSITNNKFVVSNNSNDITVTIKLTDRAGNMTEESVTFGIDLDKPVISIEYTPENGDVSYLQTNKNEKDYYKDTCAVKVTIIERNFRSENVELDTAGTIGNFPISVQELRNRLDAGKNGYEYTANIEFKTDGDFIFNLKSTDNAENDENATSKLFTIDKTLPRVNVSFDNNDARNGNYYKADRTATITVTEHNFDPDRVEIVNPSASEATFPALGGWTPAGKDVYTATLVFTADSLYKFDVVVTDKAGNVDVDNNAQEFTIDKTNPVLRITGVADESANASEGNIGFTVSATDTNFDIFDPVITAIRYKDGEFSTTRINPGRMGDIANGKQYVVTNIDTDGIYKITCTLIDKAGNAFSEVILQDVSGVEYAAKRSGDDVLLTFSVNRDGSVFYVEGYTKQLFENFYVKNVTEDVEIKEINADTLVAKTITVNGDRVLVENTDYTVKFSKDNGTWYRYTYVIKKSVFDKEGEYNLVVSTTDKAENKAFSDIKNVTAKFVVDRTAPSVTVVGLKNGGRYRTDKQVVTVIPKDDGGLLKSLIIRTVDRNGKVIDELLKLEGDSLLDAIEAGSITFELGEGLYQNVQVICEDTAGNITGGSDSGELYENISVSTNAFLIFWANKLARYLTIAGIAVVICGAIALFLFKKKKSS